MVDIHEHPLLLDVWSSLIFAHDAWQIHAAALLAARTALWLPSIVFLAFDTLLPNLAPSIKFAGCAALQKQLLKLLGLAVLYMLLLTGVKAVLSYSFVY